MDKENDLYVVADRAEVSNFAKSVRNWLSIELNIRIFGITVLSWKFPPDSNTPISK